MKESRHVRWAPYFFMTPFMLVFLAFTAYPLVQSVWLSTQQTHGPHTSLFVGLGNYRNLLSDPIFWRALQNTVVFAAASVFIQLPLALGLAMLLNRPEIRGRTIYRLIYFSPSLVGMVFVATIFGLIFEKRTGLLNVSLHVLFGFNLDYPWLQEHIMPALVIAALWIFVGFNMIYFLAALQNVSGELIEAAMVDGAGPWRRFWHITVPAIRPVATFVVLLSIIGSFQLFELPYILLGDGGPGNQGLTIVMYLFQVGFQQGDLGYASAIGWMMAALLGLIALGMQLVTPKEEG